MEIHNKLRDNIGYLKLLQEQKELPKQIIDISLSNVPYPTELKTILFEYPDWSLKILSRYHKITSSFIEDGEPLEKLLQFVEKKLFNNDGKINNEKIKTFILIDNQINKFLKEENYFQKCYDEQGISNIEITKQDVIEYKKENQIKLPTDFEYRKNQLEVIQHLKTNGLETGIHCEATGCGKSIEILLYISHCYKSNPKCKIILFTERVNILADLFDFENTSNPVNSSNVKFWKEKGICDLTKFNIVDRVTVKKSDWVSILNDAVGPTLLVINRAYLTLTDGYKKIVGLDLILHDECHNVASNKCFEFLKYIKSKYTSESDSDDGNSTKSTKSIKSVKSTRKSSSIEKKQIPIIGFSATPLRAGRTKSGDEMVLNKDRLVEIYGKSDGSGQLNLITNYNMIYAISEQLILPPQFHWFNIENYQTKKKKDKLDNKNWDGLITKSELGAVMKILDDLVPRMPNRKLVAWCGTIPLCDEWYRLFDTYKDMYENLRDIKIYKDYSKNVADNILGYNNFKHIESDGIMFCAQKHREGSDIFKLDGCIFLDKVKNRSPIPFIQSIGRVLRKEKDPKSTKTSGFVIDGVVKDDKEYEKNIVDKILGYYFALADLASIDDIGRDKTESNYSRYIKLMDLIEFEPDEKKIKLKLDKTKIEINCKRLDWANIVKNFEPILEKKVGLSEDDKLKAEFESLKKKVSKKKFSSMKEYIEWAKKYDYELEPQVKYSKLWINTYDFLSIDTSKYVDKNKFKKICLKFDITDIKNLNKIAGVYSNIPHDPCEFYRINNFDEFIIGNENYIE